MSENNQEQSNILPQEYVDEIVDFLELVLEMDQKVNPQDYENNRS